MRWIVLATCGVLVGCQTKGAPLTTSWTVAGNYQELSGCLYGRLQQTGLWSYIDRDEMRRATILLGAIDQDGPRIEFIETAADRTEVQFFLSHPESYKLQLEPCLEDHRAGGDFSLSTRSAVRASNRHVLEVS